MSKDLIEVLDHLLEQFNKPWNEIEEVYVNVRDETVTVTVRNEVA